MRVTRTRLQHLLDEVVKATARPAEPWRRVGGKNVANVGALHLDYNECYGGWDCVEIQNTSGGEDSLIGNTFAGRGRLKAHEMETFLIGVLWGLKQDVGARAD
jgi:hypothetical protein